MIAIKACWSVLDGPAHSISPVVTFRSPPIWLIGRGSTWLVSRSSEEALIWSSLLTFFPLRSCTSLLGLSLVRAECKSLLHFRSLLSSCFWGCTKSKRWTCPLPLQQVNIFQAWLPHNPWRKSLIYANLPLALLHYPIHFPWNTSRAWEYRWLFRIAGACLRHPNCRYMMLFIYGTGIQLLNCWNLPLIRHVCKGRK